MNPSNNTPPSNLTQTPTPFPWSESNPLPSRVGHRRAHSDNSFGLSIEEEEDEFLFDVDNLGVYPLDVLSPHHHHQGSIVAVDSDARLDESNGYNNSNPGGGAGGSVGSRNPSGPHRRASSMDGSSSLGLGLGSMLAGDHCVRRAMTPEKLAELALVDPKRAKRIVANRQSAARSKERKMKFTSDLEKQVQSLQTEAASLSEHLDMLKRDSSDLNNENKELKLRLELLKQQAQLRRALNDTLRQEVQRLRIATGRVPPGGGNTNQGASTSFGTQQPKQPLSPPQPQQQHFHMPTSSNQNISEQPPQKIKNFDRRA